MDIFLFRYGLFFLVSSHPAINGPGKALRLITPLTATSPKHVTAIQTSWPNPVSEITLFDLILFGSFYGFVLNYKKSSTGISTTVIQSNNQKNSKTILSNSQLSRYYIVLQTNHHIYIKYAV